MADEELKRVAGITRKILAFHRESARQVDTDVAALLDDALSLFSTEMKKKNVTVDKRFEQGRIVKVFPGEIRQVVVNLISNAIEASEEGGVLRVRMRSAARNGRPGVQILMCDRGRGIPADIRKRIFEPFYTTKELKGSGLGLWIAAGIISKHGGRISMRSSTKAGCSGTCFSIYLPVSPVADSAEGLSTRAMA
jgi:signal transduction histidine kinase